MCERCGPGNECEMCEIVEVEKTDEQKNQTKLINHFSDMHLKLVAFQQVLWDASEEYDFDIRSNMQYHFDDIHNALKKIANLLDCEVSF